jgi:hypothetical protein
MMTTETLITILSLVTLATVATAGILTCYLHDTLLQRIGLAGVCLGALSLAFHAIKNPPHIGLVIISVSGALYAVATGVKLYRVKHGTT